MNILIIYDLAMNKAILERILRMDGHITVSAGRVDDPMYLLKKENRFDLVILDVLKPESYGIEMYQAYLEHWRAISATGKAKQLPFILLWPGQDEAHALKTAGRYKFAKEVGFVDVLSKPIVHERLKETLAVVEGGLGATANASPLESISRVINESIHKIAGQNDKKNAAMLINLMERAITKMRSVIG